MAAGHDGKKEGVSSVKIFFLSFGVSLVLLLLLVWGIFWAVFDKPGASRTGQESQSDPAAEAGLTYRPASSMGLNVMVISVRERSSEPHAYTLCRFDPANDRIVLVPIPPETVVTVKAKEDTFAGHYDYAGSVNVALAAESMLLGEIDRYVRLSKGGAVNLVDALGGLTYHFEEGYEGETVSVPAGTHLLNGELFYEIANCPPSQASPESWRLGLAGELLAQKLDASADDRLDYLMEVFWNNTDTNLSQFDYTTRRKALTYFLKNEAKKIEIIPLSGTWNEDHTEFTPGKAILTELQGIFNPAEND